MTYETVSSYGNKNFTDFQLAMSPNVKTGLLILLGINVILTSANSRQNGDMNMAELDKIQVANLIREAIKDSPKKSKRVFLKTLLKMFGHKTWQRHWIEEMDKSLTKSGILVSPSLVEVVRDGWVVLSVTDTQLPVAFPKDQGDDAANNNQSHGVISR
ncbi:MAG: hypothetical protein K0B01_10470 [Syntrophobacterales bacterium]|nr:hypothetical protein [Syntrophobacterales bacterium]